MECPSFNIIKAGDQSRNKDVTHLKLKAIAIQNYKFYNQFKKAELIHIIRAYGQESTMKKKKGELGEQLLQILKNDDCVKMFRPDVFNTTPQSEATQTAQTSTDQVGHAAEIERVEMRVTRSHDLHETEDKENLEAGTSSEIRETKIKRFKLNSKTESSLTEVTEFQKGINWVRQLKWKLIKYV